MNAYSHTASGAYFPFLTGIATSELPGTLICAERASAALRPSALRALLLLSGANQSHDPVLAHTTTAELALLYETLDLLRRSEAASTA